MHIYLPVAGIPVNALLMLGGAAGFLFGVGGGFLMTPVLMFAGVPSVAVVAGSRLGVEIVSLLRQAGQPDAAAPAPPAHSRRESRWRKRRYFAPRSSPAGCRWMKVPRAACCGSGTCHTSDRMPGSFLDASMNASTRADARRSACSRPFPFSRISNITWSMGFFARAKLAVLISIT